MTRKPSKLTLEEIPGSEIPNLHAAQRAALPMISANLQSVIRALLASGALVVADGKIIPGTQG